MTYKMKPFSGFKSPLKTDTSFADRIYRKDKIDESLRKRGEHTEGNLRGKKDTTPKGNSYAGNNQMTNPDV